uniref:Family with sequence similarity 169 member B n=1 Tax=Latimeria chalumnae TaxID=7897 RepID=H3AKJ8_LATCH
MEAAEELRAGVVSYPVDVLSDVSHGVLGQAAETPSSFLLPNRLSNTLCFMLSDGTKVNVADSKVGFLSLYREDSEPKIVTLSSLQGQETVWAVFLKDRWWAVEDVMKTSNPCRHGLIQVQSLGERIVLFVLNRIILGKLEQHSAEETLFLPHSAKENAKLLWRNGEAVGFYTVKGKGTLCDGWTSQCYQLPVLDTLFVRRKHRRLGLGMKMLCDFCRSGSTEEALGISRPISVAMYKVCHKFLQSHPEEREHLWEVEAPGDWSQRSNIWLQIQLGKIPSVDAEHSETLQNNEERHEVESAQEKRSWAEDPNEEAEYLSYQEEEAEDRRGTKEVEAETLELPLPREAGCCSLREPQAEIQFVTRTKKRKSREEDHLQAAVQQNPL